MRQKILKKCDSNKDDSKIKKRVFSIKCLVKEKAMYHKLCITVNIFNYQITIKKQQRIWNWKPLTHHYAKILYKKLWRIPVFNN